MEGLLSMKPTPTGSFVMLLNYSHVLAQVCCCLECEKYFDGHGNINVCGLIYIAFGPVTNFISKLQS